MQADVFDRGKPDVELSERFSQRGRGPIDVNEVKFMEKLVEAYTKQVDSELDSCLMRILTSVPNSLIGCSSEMSSSTIGRIVGHICFS